VFISKYKYINYAHIIFIGILIVFFCRQATAFLTHSFMDFRSIALVKQSKQERNIVADINIHLGANDGRRDVHGREKKINFQIGLAISATQLGEQILD
jgi:hypothetical protein